MNRESDDLDNARKEWLSASEIALQEIATWKCMLDDNVAVLRSGSDYSSLFGGPGIEDFGEMNAQQMACLTAGKAVAASRKTFFSILRTYHGSLSRPAVGDIDQPGTVTTREIYSSSNGDRWDLQTFEVGDVVKVRHIPNAASGGKPLIVDLADFLKDDSTSPQLEALRKLLKTL